MTLTGVSRTTPTAASRAHARPATNLLATHPSSKHTLAGAPPGHLRELTLRRGEPVVTFTITALGSADDRHLRDVKAQVLGYRETRVLEPETRPLGNIAVPILNQPAPTRGPR